MLLKIPPLCSFLFFSSILYSQGKYDYNWVLGYDSNEATMDWGGTDISFNNDSVTATYRFREIDLQMTNASVSDYEGNLLFYSDGCSVFNGDHVLMEGGNVLNTGPLNAVACGGEGGGANVVQTNIIIPAPYSDTDYFLVHQNFGLDPDPVFGGVYSDKIHYTKIDMTQNDGLGVVTEKNQIIVEDSLSESDLTAVRHADGEQWWLISSVLNSSEYLILKLNTESEFEVFYQEIAPYTTFRSGSTGQVCFSPNGSKFARYDRVDGLYLYDFNRQSGLLSNDRFIELPDTLTSGGAAFSSDSRYLYITNSTKIYQIDTEAEDLEESILTVAEWDGYIEEEFFATRFNRMQLGPDCRIYISTKNSNRFMHVIHHPNRAGLECEVEQRALRLPTWNAFSIPNLPNYRLGSFLDPGEEHFCDSLIAFPTYMTSVSNANIVQQDFEFTLYPNPASEFIKVSLAEYSRLSYELSDYTGKTLRLGEMTGAEEIDLSGLPSGFYFLTLVNEEGLRGTRKFLVTR